MSHQSLELQLPAIGWRQFLTSKKEMLDKYDDAKEKGEIRKVATEHGNVAEAAFREWLAEFLPKRYAVTSGFVISLGKKHTDKLPHFDVIIYDQLETPILWKQKNPDFSYRGYSLAIPVENVLAVFEVKSRFNAENVKSALNHLAELKSVMSGFDAASNPYKLHLPTAFFCGLVFFELCQADAYSKAGINRIATESLHLRRFMGGLILRGEGLQEREAGRIQMGKGDTPILSFNGKGKKKVSLLKTGMSDSIPMANAHYNAMLTWGEPNFASFAFDIVALLNGTYTGRASSFYGLGSDYMESNG